MFQRDLEIQGMPIYEFKCLKCEEFVELLVMNKDEEDELKCTKCGGQSFERVMSRTNFTLSNSCASKSAQNFGGKQERTCSSGSCTTYTVPGID